MRYRKYNNGGYLMSDISTGASVGGAIAPGIGHAVGAAAGLTTSAGGALYNKSNFIQDIWNGDAKNSKLKKAALIGLGGPLAAFGMHRAAKDAREKETLEQQQLLQDQNLFDIQSKQVLATYPTQGVRGIQSFRNGGKIEMINNDLGKFVGASHEQGGIKIPVPEGIAEVEGGETIDNEGQIFSDTLKPNKETLEIIKSFTGKNVKGTHAKISEILGKMSEDVDVDENRFQKQTKELMKPRMSNALDILFQDQERQKIMSNDMYYRYGGKIKKYYDGRDGAYPVSMMGKIDRSGKYVKALPEQVDYFEGTDFDPNSVNFNNIYNEAEAGFQQTPVQQTPSFRIQPPLTEGRDPNEGLSSMNDYYNSLQQNPVSDFNKIYQGSQNFGNTVVDNRRGPNSTFTDVSKKLPTSITKNNNTSTGKTNTIPEITNNNNVNSRTRRLNDPRGIQDLEFDMNIEDDLKGFLNNVSPTETKLPSSTVKSKSFNMNNINIGSAIPQLANLANYAFNKKKINELDTNLKPKFVASPRYNYIDTSSAQRADIDRIAGNTINTLRGASPQGLDSATIGSIVSAQIQGRNQVAADEGARENLARQNFNNLSTQVNSTNAGIANTFGDMNTQLKNDKVGAELDAANAFTKGVIGNIQVDKMMEMDGAKALLTAVQQGDTEVVTRLLEEYPQLKSILRLDRMNYGKAS